MPWFSRRNRYDRKRILTKARRAAARRSHRKAIALYEQVRAVEPHDTDVLRDLAIERARAGQVEAGWRDARLAAQGLLKRGEEVERAIEVLRAFAAHAPRKLDVWRGLAELELRRARPAQAVAALLEGRRAFRGRRHRREAIVLLRQAHGIDPSHFATGYDLAGLLARTGAVDPALRILDTLASGACSRREARRLLARRFRVRPTRAAAWGWLSAWFGRVRPSALPVR